MKNYFLSLFIIFTVFQGLSSAQISVGYINGYYDSYPASEIKFNNLTHLIMAFIHPNADGTISYEWWFLNPQLVDAAHQNGVQVLVGVGGYGGSDGFSPMAADTSARRKFINNLINFCLTNNFDGVDLDWEYPKANDRNNFTALAAELRKAIDIAGLSTLSAAIPSTDWSNAYDIANLKNSLDWFGVMTYDFYGPWESTSGHDSPLYSSNQQYGSADRSVNYYLSKGMPRDKMCIGTHFSGYVLNSNSLFSGNSGGSSISYKDANEKLKQGWKYYWDDVCKVPYLQNSANTQIITYSDSNAVKLKFEYIRKNNLRGTIIWKIGQDYNGTNAPLLSLTKKYLLNYPSKVPLAPELVEPLNNSILDTNSIKLMWSPTDSTTSYNLQIALDTNFTNIFINKTINIPCFELKNLNTKQKYFWRVSSENINGEGNWSEIRSFEISSVTSVENTQQKSFGFSLEQNFPNPFSAKGGSASGGNPSTTIMFTLAANSNVDLRIYNMLGEEAAVIINNTFKPAGMYAVKFSAADFPSGTYIYRLITNNKIYSKKMTLLK